MHVFYSDTTIRIVRLRNTRSTNTYVLHTALVLTSAVQRAAAAGKLRRRFFRVGSLFRWRQELLSPGVPNCQYPKETPPKLGRSQSYSYKLDTRQPLFHTNLTAAKFVRKRGWTIANGNQDQGPDFAHFVFKTYRIKNSLFSIGWICKIITHREKFSLLGTYAPLQPS